MRFLREHGLKRWRTFWEAHHKHAVSEGGGECGLENYETLCLWCHKRETKALHGRLSRQKADAGRSLLSGMCGD